MHGEAVSRTRESLHYLDVSIFTHILSGRAVIIAFMIAVPVVFSVLYFIKRPLSLNYRHFAVAAFYVVFEVSCLSSKIFVYNLFVFPVMIATMMYFDCTFEIRLAVVNNILVVANGIYSAKVLGSDDRTSLNQIYMTVLVVMILNISIYIASKAAEVHNKEEIEELERGRRVQEEMMQSIISAGKVINSAAQSIKGTVSEVAQAAKLKDTNMVLIGNNSNLSSASEEISAASEETTAMCTQNSDRFMDVNRAVEELAAQAARMNEYIEKYTVSHENSVMAVQTEEGVSELLSAV